MQIILPYSAVIFSICENGIGLTVTAIFADNN